MRKLAFLRNTRPPGREGNAPNLWPAKDEPKARFLIQSAVWIGLLTGLIEVAILVTQKVLFQRVINSSQEFVWMTPLVNLLLLIIAGLALILLARVWPRLVTRRLAIFVFALFGFMNLLLMYLSLQHYAALLLAVGLAVQTARLVARHQSGFHRLVTSSLRWMLLVIVVLAALVSGSQMMIERRALAQLPPAPAGAPNVLFITLDTVRAHNLSVYGYGRRTTPQLERLAARGVVFERALATAPWTLPSHASMFTGRLPHELGADWEVALDNKYPTLAEVFKSHGYSTAGFVANTGYCSYEHGLNRGFTHYDDYQFSLGQLLSSSTLVRTFANNFRVRRTLRNDEHLNRRPAAQINDSFLRWLSNKGERPFFAFLNYYDAHDPYLPPAPYDKSFGPGRKEGKLSPLHRSNWDPAAKHQKLSPEEIQTEIDAYDGAIAYLDHQLGLLFDELDRRGLWDNTLVIVTSDHGEEFGEHGVFDHGNSLYLSAVHVPLLIAFPSRVPAGKVVHQAVSLRDLAATVLDVLQLDNHAGLPGSSLAQRWNGSETRSHHSSVDPLLSEVNFAPNLPEWYPVSKGDMKAVVLGGYRYIRNGDGREELYDFNRDPFEEHDLSRSAEGRPLLERYSTALKTLLSR